MSATASATSAMSTGVSKTSSRRRRSAPKLKESCDCCAIAKVRCTRERPSCLRCRSKGNDCQYSISRRAGRKTMRNITVTPISTSGSDTSSSIGSPVQVSAKPSFVHTDRSSFSDSSPSSSTSSTFGDYVHGLPIPPCTTPEMTEHLYNNQDLAMWTQAAFISSQGETDANADWYGLADSFSHSTLAPSRHVYESKPHPATPTSTSSSSTRDDEEDSPILESIEFPPLTTLPHHHSQLLSPDETTCEDPDIPFPQDIPMFGSAHQEAFLFAETEAIREELRLVANYVSTLEERVDRGVRCAGLQQKAAMEAKALCGDLESNDVGMAAEAGNLVARFDANDLRRRLGSIRHEIECIVGFG
ncbi:hypothetical protein CKM354_000720600 [Cercospora kikuchii]|uniref:Zn(2)-C6 fungal-type domain-containing protein n=1 Tax=Cercospora kikuchii TaxID=84275 RepID=A0A9P3FH95_9PEZI|nr:uncharacterized protein CKM354_000720600 [Cercospora kikuchii]GIZ43997.1 hypothetical protein CKM354_000720600 [Cercospora kikuchii]